MDHCEPEARDTTTNTKSNVVYPLNDILLPGLVFDITLWSLE